MTVQLVGGGCGSAGPIGGLQQGDLLGGHQQTWWVVADRLDRGRSPQGTGRPCCGRHNELLRLEMEASRMCRPGQVERLGDCDGVTLTGRQDGSRRMQDVDNGTG